MSVSRYGIVFLPVLLVACGTVPVNAPVTSRDAVPQSQAASTAIPAAAPKPGYYVVRRGDTLYSIAWQNGLNFRQLADMNAIGSPYTIYVGQTLRITSLDTTRATPIPATLPEPVAAPPPRPVASVRVEPRAIASPEPETRSDPAMVPVAPPVQAAIAADNPVTAPEPKSESELPAAVSRWVWPTRGPLLRGFTPDANGKKGIDIGGKAGQPIMSAADGKVVYSGSGLVGYGRLIIIKHNDSLLSAYGHNSELLVAEGDYVKAGQVIAKMGSSGTSSTRLYFEIRQDGKPVNPLRYLPHG